MTSKREEYLGKKARQWIIQQYKDSPPKGWRSVEWIRVNVKGGKINRQTCKEQLDKLVELKEIPPPEKYKVENHYKSFYYIGL